MDKRGTQGSLAAAQLVVKGALCKAAAPVLFFHFYSWQQLEVKKSVSTFVVEDAM